MKTVLSLFLGFFFLTWSHCQTLESVILQIEDLKAERVEHEKRIEAIDQELERLLHQRQELSESVLNEGHPAHTISETTLYGTTHYNNAKEEVTTIPKGTRLIIDRAESLGIMRTSYGGMTCFVHTYKLKFENPDSEGILKEQMSARAQAAAKVKEEERAQIRAEEAEERKKEAEAEAKEREAAAAKARAEREDKIKGKYSAVDAERVIAHKIWIGMTKEMLIDSWGYPDDINRSVGSWGVHEQCVYERSYGNKYVYIENGKVTSWQD